jgi:RNA polymerase sigma factor (sigma-70 family)
MVRNWGIVLKRVRAMLMRRGRTSEDADDLVQEAWVRLAVYARETPVVEPTAFMYRTAMNLAVTADRVRAARGEVLLEDGVTLMNAAPSAEAAVLARERIARLDVCLRRLSGRTRAIFLDVRFGGLSYLQAAQRHHVSTSAVEKHVAKATMLITRCMEDW